MNTTCRRLCTGIAIALTAALTTTACIGVDPGDLPAPGQPTRFIFHPEFSNTAFRLTNPGDVNGSYVPAPSKGTPRSVELSFPVRVLCLPGDNCPATRSHKRAVQRVTVPVVRQPNKSFVTDFTFPANLCRYRDLGEGVDREWVTVTVKWSNGPTESVQVPTAAGPGAGNICPRA